MLVFPNKTQPNMVSWAAGVPVACVADETKPRYSPSAN